MEFAASSMMWLMMILNGPPEAIDSLHPMTVLEMRPEILNCALKLQIISRYNLSLDINTRQIWDDEGIGRFEKPEEYAVRELKEIYDTYHELKNVPLVEEMHSKLFMPRRICQQNLNFNREYQTNIEKRIEWEPNNANLIKTCLIEAKELHSIWNQIDNLNIESSDKIWIRKSWLELKSLIKENISNDSELPDYVPSWRFYKGNYFNK